MIHRSYTIRFVLHRRKDTPRQYLQMRVTPRGGKPISFATGVSLTAAEWDPMVGRAKGRTQEAAEANTLIAQWSQLVANVFSHYDSLNIVPTADQLRKAFERATDEVASTTAQYIVTPSRSMTLIAAFTQFVVELQREGNVSQGTIGALQSYRRMLGDFLPETPINNIDVPFMEAFHQWMVNDRRQQGVTVNGNLAKMRWFLRWARKKGIYSGTVDQEYRPRIKGSGIRARSIVFLTIDELRKVEEYEFPNWAYNQAKDVFLFGCYTGLRSSDLIKLERADCFDDYISVMTQKTSHNIHIPLNAKAKAILDRYKGCKIQRRQKVLGVKCPALPCPGNKTMNRHLHKIMEAIGINDPTRHVYYIGSERHDEVVPKSELISLHTARHTFIVTAISLGIPIPVIMEWTGHSGYNNMKPYIAVANATSKHAMELFNTI